MLGLRHYLPLCFFVCCLFFYGGCKQVEVQRLGNSGVHINQALNIRTSDGVELYAYARGQGPVCVFLHGGPGAWSASFEQLGGRALESFFTMVYFDQRGCGRSGKGEDYSLSRMTMDIEELREQLKCKLGSERVYFLAHSFGGVLATSYAARYPENVQGLILANVTLDLVESINGQIAFCNQLTGGATLATGSKDIIQRLGLARVRLAESGLEHRMLTANQKAFIKVREVDEASPSNYDFARRIWDYSEYLGDFVTGSAKCAMPTLVIAGTSDQAVGPEHHKRFQFPRAKVVEISGGHLLYYERNAEFVSAVQAFLTGISSCRQDK